MKRSKHMATWLAAALFLHFLLRRGLFQAGKEALFTDNPLIVA